MNQKDTKAKRTKGQMAVDLADVAKLDTFPKLLAYNAERFGSEVAMREKEFGIWIEFTWGQYRDRVRAMMLGFEKLGVGQDDCIGFIGQNRPELVWTEVAAHGVRAKSLGIYADSIGDEVTYLINYAQCKLIVAEDEEQVDKLLELGDEVPSLEHIVYTDARGLRKYDDPRLIDIADLYAMGEEIHAAQPARFDELVAASSGDDTAILCTTSGTTSKPKLAMMKAGPFLDHCWHYLKADPKRPDDDYVSVLPLPWIMEQVYAVAQALISRITVNFVEEPETMMADMREIGPTFVLLAPRTWEAVAADVRSRMMDSDAFKRRMFDLGMKLGMEAVENGSTSKLADLLLFNALKDRLGFTFLRSAATGGAALGPETFKFFLAMGVPLRQLYGQTELCGAYTLHEPDDVDFDTVGVPFQNAEVKVIDADENGVGEIVARNSGMFTGYYKNEEATKADIRDGWMHTGDAGYFNDGGHLVVIDRIKDLAETTRGAKFSPMFIENKLKFSPFIAEAVILGNDKPYLSAMICIRFSIVSKWAEQRRISFTNYTNLSSRPEVYQLLREEVEKVNSTLPEAQKIQKFLLLYKELDADDGELTRTRKVRRSVIDEKYEDIIDAVYGDQDSVHVDTMITFQDGTQSRIVTDLGVVTLIKNEASPPSVQAAE
ncbi:MAG: long-chain fatty acid--CoA ligase [Magnetovibrionaceae bacterium]